MVLGIIEKLKNYSENINFELLITTTIFILISLIYFYYRLKRLVQPINIEDNIDDQNNNNVHHQNVNNNSNRWIKT